MGIIEAVVKAKVPCTEAAPVPGLNPASSSVWPKVIALLTVGGVVMLGVALFTVTFTLAVTLL